MWGSWQQVSPSNLTAVSIKLAFFIHLLVICCYRGPELQGSGPEVTDAGKGVKFKSLPGQDPAGPCGSVCSSSKLERLAWILGLPALSWAFLCSLEKMLDDFF